MAEHWGESQLMWAILERNVPNLTWWVVICRTEGTKTTDPLMPPKVNKVCWLFGSVDLMFIAYAIPMKQMVSLFFTIFWLSFSERHSYSFSALQNNFCVWSGTLPELSPCVPDTHSAIWGTSQEFMKAEASWMWKSTCMNRTVKGCPK